MKFGTLTAQNFLSFKEASLDLSKHSLALIVGVNEDSKSSSSNGSGKSNMLEAFAWVSYGECFRPWKGDEVICNKVKKNCLVSLDFQENGTKGRIERFRKLKGAGTGLKLVLNGKDVSRSSIAETQELINSLLGADFSTFSNSISFPYKTTKPFAALTDKEQKAILEKILGLEALSEYLRIVKEKKQNKELKLSAIASEKDTEEALQSEVSESIIALQAQERDFEAQKAQDIRDIQEAIDDINKDVSQVASSKAYALTAAKTIKDRIAQLKTGLALIDEKAMKEAETEAVGEGAKYVQVLSTIGSEIVKLREKIDRADSISQDASCPYCGQKLTKQHINKYIRELKEEIKKSTDKRPALKAKVGIAEKTVDDAREGLQSLSRSLLLIEKHKDDLQAVQLRSSKVESELAVLEKQREIKEAEIKQKRAEKSPFGKLIEEKEVRKAKLEKKIEAMSEKEDKIQLSLEYLSFWETGFGNRGLKGYILDNVIGVLNQKANAYSKILTDGDAKINFHTQTQLKGGDVREKFGVDVEFRNGTETYIGTSGGEGRRADLAILLALRYLACSRTSKKFNILIADEIFDALDVPGTERAMELLREESKNGCKIFLITHHPDLLNKDIFGSTVTVTKKGGVSTLVS